MQETEEYDLKSAEDELVDGLLHRWKFFLPSPDLAEDILRLNRELGAAYFDREYAALDAREEQAEDVEWFRRLSGHASKILSHDGEADGVHRGESGEEELSFLRASISERIFNHLTMLARSRYALQGGAFSLREELTIGLAEKIGLGLYLHRKTSRELHDKAENVLLRLAGEFQHWFVDAKDGKDGAAETTWGMIYKEGKDVIRIGGFYYLILTPDVEEREEFDGSK